MDTLFSPPAVENKRVRQQEQLENIYYYHWCFPLELRSQPQRGSWGDSKKYPGRVALQITYGQSPAAAVGIVACTHVMFEQATSAIFSNLSYRVE